MKTKLAISAPNGDEPSANRLPWLIWENDRDTLTDCRSVVAETAQKFGFFPAFLNHEAADNAVLRFKEAKKQKTIPTQCGLILRELRQDADLVIMDVPFDSKAEFEIPEFYLGKTFSLNGKILEMPPNGTTGDYQICGILQKLPLKTAEKSKCILAVNNKLTPQAWLIICREALLNNKPIPRLEIKVSDSREYTLFSEICKFSHGEIIYAVSPELKPFGKGSLHCRNFFELAVKKILSEKRPDLISRFPEVKLPDFLSGNDRHELRKAASELKDDINTEIKSVLSDILSFTYCK